MKGNRLFILFNISIFLLILDTSQAWMFWNIDTGIRALIYITIFGIGLLNFKNLQHKYKKNEFFVIGAIFLFLAYWFKSGASFLGIMQMLIYAIMMWLIMMMPVNKKRDMLSFQTKTLGIFLTISLVAWGIHFLIPFPYSSIQRIGYEDYLPFHNYYLFVTTYSGFYDIRFHSIFLEPGHLGCITAFFVLANQYNFKNRFVLLLSVVLLFSMSLAGYLLFFVGFLFYLFGSVGNLAKYRRFFSIGIVFLGIWLYGTYYNGGDNYVKERLLNRFLYDEEIGSIAGDTRYSEEIEKKFDEVIQSSDIVLGVPVADYHRFRAISGEGAGIKLWIIQKGIVGALILFLGYYFIAKSSNNRRWAMIMLLVYVISGYQRMYFLWASYLIPFICGSALPFLERKQNNKDI